MLVFEIRGENKIEKIKTNLKIKNGMQRMYN